MRFSSFTASYACYISIPTFIAEYKFVMEGASNSTFPIGFEIVLLLLGALFFIVALFGSIPSPWGPIGSASKPVRVILGTVGVIQMSTALLWSIPPCQPPVEDCSYINPSVVQPTAGWVVSSPTTVQGTVTEVPRNSVLWLMIYDKKKNTYINASQLTVDSEKQWRKGVDFTGSMVGSRCSLQVILADPTTHTELNEFAKSQQAPSKITRCAQVEVVIGP